MNHQLCLNILHSDLIFTSSMHNSMVMTRIKSFLSLVPHQQKLEVSFMHLSELKVLHFAEGTVFMYLKIIQFQVSQFVPTPFHQYWGLFNL